MTTKKILLSMALLGCCLTKAHAQVGEHRNDLSVGVNGGYVLNKISFNPTIKQAYHGGLTFGATARFTCEKYFNMLCAIQAEVNMTQLGWKEVIETCPDTYQRDITYVQVPLLAHLAYGKERGGLKGYLVIGPQLGYCIGDKEVKNEWENETNPQRPNNRVEQYGKEIEKKFEYGITGGLGIEASTKSGHRFLLEGRYNFSLSDIFNNSKQDTFNRSANGGITVKVSYLFDVIKTRGI